ncbi:MAG: hypothetical protein HeimC2_27950 [Candidatus Heimdallarchaeota archaeon LC_2]|nr:MAG: hypothetical protein HeimC2_27950 [Candidatus Heimdallarchaeota archaeon LC_2]
MRDIFEIIDELLVSGHPAVIHFPIIGIVMAMVAGYTALMFAIIADLGKDQDWMTKDRKVMLSTMVDRFGFASWIMDFMGIIGLIVAAWSGFKAAGSLDSAVSSDLLAFKIKLSIYVFFLLLTPLLLKVYLNFLGKPIFGESKLIPLLYLLPIMIAAVLTLLISGAGGRYTYGHSILDTLGLGYLLPS